MSSITTIQGTDVISTSRTDINTNFANLNADKIETSVLDTDTTLAANSDAKVPTQKAVKAYVDASVNPTGRSWNEYAVDAVGTDSYAITVSGVSAYVAGMTFKFKAGTANTGACSLNVNALGAKTIKKDVSSDLATGDILANQIVVVTYDGTNFQMSSPLPGVVAVSLLAGENITASDGVVLGGATLLSNTPAIGASNGFGRAGGSAQEKAAQSIQETPRLPGISTITLRLGKTGSPTDNAVIQIQTDSAGSPSGSVLATASIAAASISTTASDVTVTLDTPVIFTGATKYWIVFTRSGSGDDSNYYQVGGSVASSYANGAAKYYSSSAWTGTVDAADIYFILKNVVGTIYKSSAAISATCAGFAGFAQSAITSGNMGNIILSGYLAGFSGLTGGSQYYLSDTNGSISTSAGTVTRKVGIAINTTTILITNIW